jgi:transposase-like protein
MFDVVDGRSKLISVRGRLFPADGNWYEWRQDPPLPASVLVRVAAVADGRLVLTGLRIEGEPTAQILRSIPVGRIEAAANAQLTAVDDAVVPAAVLRRRPSAAHQPQASEQGWDTTSPARAQARPTEPAGTVLELAQQRGGTRRRHPDDFYRHVAAAYLSLAQASSRPAAELAEANGVPVSTTHRWIKEARHRGFLPPGRPGKAG